eukprot:5830754-Lingulodinium_polyedra.AAC.1
MTRYLQAGREFLQWVRENQMPVYPHHCLDMAMAQYLDAMCFEHRAPRSRGGYALWGILALYPGLALPEATRAWKSWESLEPTGEGRPAAAELLM